MARSRNLDNLHLLFKFYFILQQEDIESHIKKKPVHFPFQQNYLNNPIPRGRFTINKKGEGVQMNFVGSYKIAFT